MPASAALANAAKRGIAVVKTGMCWAAKLAGTCLVAIP